MSQHILFGTKDSDPELGLGMSDWEAENTKVDCLVASQTAALCFSPR